MMNLRKIISKLFEYIPLKTIKPSDQTIDVVIPIIKKDLPILPLCIKGIKECVLHHIRAIYIVAPDVNEIIDFCEHEHLIYVSEKSVLGIEPKDINLIIANPNGSVCDRSGWLFQQLLKLSGRIGTCENYLCIDADHILIQPHSFIDQRQTPIFYMSSENHLPYYKNITILTGIKEFSCLSYVSHKMLFNKSELNKLQLEIKKHTGKNWITAIVDYYNRNEGADFSEFELYGNFIKKKRLRPWKQISLTYDEKIDYKSLFQKYGKKFKSITFPYYLNSF